MAIRLTPDPERIARLQDQAARHPALYRWRVGAMAVTGDVVLTTLLILPAALPVTVGLLFFNYPNKYWLAAIFIAFLVWIMRPTFRFDGRELTPEEAPRLFAEIDALGFPQFLGH